MWRVRAESPRNKCLGRSKADSACIPFNPSPGISLAPELKATPPLSCASREGSLGETSMAARAADQPPIRPDRWRSPEVRRVAQARLSAARRCSAVHTIRLPSRIVRSDSKSRPIQQTRFLSGWTLRNGVSLPEKFVGQLLPTAVTDSESCQGIGQKGY